MQRDRLPEVLALYLAFVLGATKALMGLAAVAFFVPFEAVMAPLSFALLVSLGAAAYFVREDPEWAALFALIASAYATRPLRLMSEQEAPPLAVHHLLPCVMLFIALHYPRTWAGWRGRVLSIVAGGALASGMVSMIAPAAVPWDVWVPWVAFVAVAVGVLAVRCTLRESRALWLLAGSLPLVSVMVADVVSPGLVPDRPWIEWACNLWLCVAPLGAVLDDNQNRRSETWRSPRKT